MEYIDKVKWFWHTYVNYINKQDPKVEIIWTLKCHIPWIKMTGQSDHKHSVFLIVCVVESLLLHYYTTTFEQLVFQDNLGKQVLESENPTGFKWGKRWWGFGMQWHPLDHMQTVRTSLQRDNHVDLITHFYSVSRHWRHLLLHTF